MLEAAASGASHVLKNHKPIRCALAFEVAVLASPAELRRAVCENDSPRLASFASDPTRGRRARCGRVRTQDIHAQNAKGNREARGEGREAVREDGRGWRRIRGDVFRGRQETPAPRRRGVCDSAAHEVRGWPGRGGRRFARRHHGVRLDGTYRVVFPKPRPRRFPTRG